LTKTFPSNPPDRSSHEIKTVMKDQAIPELMPDLAETTDQIQTVTGDEFNDVVLAGAGPIAVEFMSYGCPHCRTIEPVLQRVAEMVKSKEKIFRVNVAVEQELASSYEIQGTPSLIMFLNGRQVGRIEGPSPTVASVLTAVTHPFKL
jgi:thioredoxin 1